MVVGTLLLTVALAVGGLARSPIYRESYASPRYPAYQVYQPLPSAAPQAFPGGAGAYVPLSSYYQSNASSPPVYQPATSQPARSSYQPVLHQAVGSQYQAAEPLYQPPQPQYQPVEPQYQPVQPQYQLAEPQYQPVQAQYQLAEPQYQPVEPQYQPAQPQYQPTEPQYQPAEPQYQPAQPQYQPIESQYQSQDQYGQYAFGFAGGDSARSETRGADGSVRGSYSYVDEDGQTQTQHYVADEFGFRVTGTNLPRVPEVPASAASVPAHAHEPLPTPQPVQDTPEVAAAKAAFIKAYNEAAIAAAEAPDVD